MTYISIGPRVIVAHNLLFSFNGACLSCCFSKFEAQLSVSAPAVILMASSSSEGMPDLIDPDFLLDDVSTSVGCSSEEDDICTSTSQGSDEESSGLPPLVEVGTEYAFGPASSSTSAPAVIGLSQRDLLIAALMYDQAPMWTDGFRSASATSLVQPTDSCTHDIFKASWEAFHEGRVLRRRSEHAPIQ